VVGGHVGKMEVLKRNKTCDLVSLPSGKIQCKCVYTVKQTPKGKTIQGEVGGKGLEPNL
jgi:hypothetical protein